MNRRTLIFCVSLSMLCAIAAEARESEGHVTKALQKKVQNVVIIYAENRSFDNLYGLFPGANGIPGVNPTAKSEYRPQVDRDGAQLASLPQAWGGVTAAGQTPVVTQAQSAGLPNRPYNLNKAFGVDLGNGSIMSDMWHRFFENQMQIGDGSNNKFAAFSDSGGLAMSYVDGSAMQMWKIAQQYTLADNFFMGAFGGSYLNHQYLICACAPEYPNADTAAAKPTIAELDKDSQGKFLPRLTLAVSSPASTMDGPPVFVHSGNITPKNYFGDGTFRSINTMQPPYQPSAVPPAIGDSAKVYADPSRASTLPPQTQQTIGDLLTAKGIEWKWYAGAWNETLNLATTTRRIERFSPGIAPNFQFHHQPFNYYAAFDPVQHADRRHAVLKDYNDLLTDIRGGTLPAVTFYKPQGNMNQHPGYAAITVGDEHIATLIRELEGSPQWKNMVVVVTYDENGGLWDHVTPPKGDLLGPGTRIPAIVISPFAKRGFIDHTQYDTASTLRLITRRFNLKKLAGIAQRDAALKKHKSLPMGDLTQALQL